MPFHEIMSQNQNDEAPQMNKNFSEKPAIADSMVVTSNCTSANQPATTKVKEGCVNVENTNQRRAISATGSKPPANMQGKITKFNVSHTKSYRNCRTLCHS